jgi:hypothetical protein
MDDTIDHMNAEEVRQQYLTVLGPELGPVCHDLYNQRVWLHVKWHQFLELYGNTPERLDLLNGAAPVFFRIVHDTLLEDTLLNLTRLTDPAFFRDGDNQTARLTLRSLPGRISEDSIRAEVEELIKAAISATAFARDWRNRRIAHHDLNLSLNVNAKPLAPASRDLISDALAAVCRPVERVSELYLQQTEVRLNRITETLGGDAVSLLYVIRDGLEADVKRRQRIRERKFEPDDLKPLAKV